MSDAKSNPPVIAGVSVWIWAAAVTVLVILLAGGGYWWLQHSHKTTVAQKRPNLLGVMGETVTQLDNTLPDRNKMCPAMLARAMDFGVLPPGSTLASPDAQAAKAEGHYTCQAKAADGAYTIAIDTSCPGTDQKTCFALESVRRQDGIMTFQRRS